MSAFVLQIATVPIIEAESTPKPAPSVVVATVGPDSITTQDLEDFVGSRLIRIETELFFQKKRLLEEHVFKILLKREAAARRLAEAELLEREVNQKAKAPTLEDARIVYEATRDRFRGQGENAALLEIQKRLQQQRVTRRQREFGKELEQRTGVKVLLDAPRATLTEESTDYVKGPSSAPITIVEFGDYQCPFCAQASPTLRRLEERYGNRIRRVFRDLPLPSHNDAPKAAEAAACASDQGRFWEMHEELFQGQRDLSVAGLNRIAAKVGLDSEQFKACLDSSKHHQDWNNRFQAASRLGVLSTPVFFVNGRLLMGAVGFENFVEVIDDELVRTGEVKASGRLVP